MQLIPLPGSLNRIPASCTFYTIALSKRLHRYQTRPPDRFNLQEDILYMDIVSAPSKGHAAFEVLCQYYSDRLTFGWQNQNRLLSLKELAMIDTYAKALALSVLMSIGTPRQVIFVSSGIWRLDQGPVIAT